MFHGAVVSWRPRTHCNAGTPWAGLPAWCRPQHVATDAQQQRRDGPSNPIQLSQHRVPPPHPVPPGPALASSAHAQPGAAADGVPCPQDAAGGSRGRRAMPAGRSRGQPRTACHDRRTQPGAAADGVPCPQDAAGGSRGRRAMPAGRSRRQASHKLTHTGREVAAPPAPPRPTSRPRRPAGRRLVHPGAARLVGAGQSGGIEDPAWLCSQASVRGASAHCHSQRESCAKYSNAHRISPAAACPLLATPRRKACHTPAHAGGREKHRYTHRCRRSSRAPARQNGSCREARPALCQRHQQLKWPEAPPPPRAAAARPRQRRLRRRLPRCMNHMARTRCCSRCSRCPRRQPPPPAGPGPGGRRSCRRRPPPLAR